MYCPNCNSEVLTEVKTVSETYPVKGEEITVTAKVRCCKNCGQGIWDEELDGQNLLEHLQYIANGMGYAARRDTQNP